MAKDIKMNPINVVEVPRPYRDTTHSITDGIYIHEMDYDQLCINLGNIYGGMGYEVVGIKPLEITLRKYLDDNNQTSNKSASEGTEGTLSRQPATEQDAVQQPEHDGSGDNKETV